MLCLDQSVKMFCFQNNSLFFQILKFGNLFHQPILCFLICMMNRVPFPMGKRLLVLSLSLACFFPNHKSVEAPWLCASEGMISCMCPVNGQVITSPFFLKDWEAERKRTFPWLQRENLGVEPKRLRFRNVFLNCLLW